MIKFFCCRRCRVEIEPVNLADGTAALVCIDCDLIGFAHEIGEGGRVWAAGTSRAGKQGVKMSNKGTSAAIILANRTTVS